MSILFWLVEIPLIVLAIIGVMKIRDDIRRRSLPYDGYPPPRYRDIFDEPDNQWPSRGSTQTQSAPEPQRKQYQRRSIPGPRAYLRLEVNNGSVPQTRPRRGFTGRLKSIK